MYTKQIYLNFEQYLPLVEIIAKSRHFPKRNYSSTRDEHDYHEHFIGALAELDFHLNTGLDMDLDCLRLGDNGYDFSFVDQHGNVTTYDCKCVSFYKNPILKVPVSTKKWADIYVLYAVRQQKYLRIIGWATKEQILECPIKTFNSTMGPQYSMSIERLKKLNQLGYPPEICLSSKLDVPNIEQTTIDELEKLETFIF